MSKKHYGKQTGCPVTHQLPTARRRRATGNLRALDAGEARAEEAGHHAIGRAAGIPGEATREREARAAAQDTALMRALGLAHHWQRLLDEERAASVAEIAKAEGMDVTQVRRVMRLTLLAPEVIERLVGAPDMPCWSR
jgi:hypothetical protein